MYITVDVIIKFAALIGAVTAIGGVIAAVLRWLGKQEKQSADIEKLKSEHVSDIKAIEDELSILSYALMACLDGLHQLGANGPVTEIHNKLEKYLNQKAHNCPYIA